MHRDRRDRWVLLLNDPLSNGGGAVLDAAAAVAVAEDELIVEVTNLDVDDEDELEEEDGDGGTEIEGEGISVDRVPTVIVDRTVEEALVVSELGTGIVLVAEGRGRSKEPVIPSSLIEVLVNILSNISKLRHAPKPWRVCSVF